MIDKDYFKEFLVFLGFKENQEIFTKKLNDYLLEVDFKKEKIIYPNELKVNEQQTINFSSLENIVVFEVVYQLLKKGYKPKHIELEPRWRLGRGASGGRADILVKDQTNKNLLIIECKTYGKEFKKEWEKMLENGGQLFSYAQQIQDVKYLCLYASEFDIENKTIKRTQKIISHQDKIFDSDKTFQKATNAIERYQVWRDVYDLEYSENGIFEDNIQAYNIGKDKYTLKENTRPINSDDKKGKYHKFRTILRQHSIARRETAFEVLVNLFLAKIVDEKINSDNLQFYWNGVVYDNYYDFIDRLQNLYQKGMEEFLSEKVMYISKEEIENAFWPAKRNAIKDDILKYFTQLKFFSNNAFSLIDVHNDITFRKNVKVLIELVKMWQNLRLTTTEQNQFLGDMFEYFLDNSIKQSEGQFFTPIPITKFIVSSLPLEEKVKDDNLKAVDYACGSGHFLNEYAHQITPLVKKLNKNPKDYYKNIVGIEKEDRLAKIAKVSAHMYGQGEIKIIENDALSDLEIENNSFDVLIANPPFAVEGFLLTLDEKSKEKFELLKTTEKNSNTNNIQCFFIERAKHLINKNGVLGIIIPSSILSNTDNTHIATREIILKYFDIIALVELGGGTFGKTGTNTIILFLRRKPELPEQAIHYKNRVEDFFDNEIQKEIYEDEFLVKHYCEYNKIPFEEYKKLFGFNNIDELDKLFEVEIFKLYKKEFENSTQIKNLKNKKSFKEKLKTDQQKELNKKLLEFIINIEKDKLYYFILAYKTKNKVLIVKSPTNNKEQKKFLGYEWSGAKGSEGIKYIGGENINDIITPLFNPNNRDDETKINYLIKQNFLGKKVDLSKVEYKNINYVNVEDLLDFSRVDFTKTFSLNPKQNITIESKYELVRLGELAKIVGKGKRPASFENENGDIPFFVSSNIIKKCLEYDYNQEALLIGDGGSANIHYINGKFSVSDHVFIIEKLDLSLKYIYYFLSVNIYLLQKGFEGIGIKNLKKSYLEEQIKIPLPPKDIQEKIVKECEKVDDEVTKAKEIISKANEEIENRLKSIKFENLIKIGEISEVIAGQSPKSEFYNEEKNGLPFYQGKKEFGEIYLKEPKVWTKKTTKISYKNDILISVRAPVGDVNINPFDKICIGRGLNAIRVSEKVINKYLFYFIKFNKNLFKGHKGTTFDSISRNEILEIKIPLPPLEEQKKLVKQIEKFEDKIKEAKNIINSSKAKKEKILDKYLKGDK